MSKKTRIAILVLAAVLVLVWGIGMEDSDDGGGYSDETTYFSAEEVKERQKVIEQMAQMRGETPPPTASPKAEKKDDKTLDEPYASIPMQDAGDKSLTLKAIGYDKNEQILLAEFNMTGLIYAYFDVPEEEYVKLIEAENFDKWFEFMIMKKFEFRQLN